MLVKFFVFRQVLASSFDMEGTTTVLPDVSVEPVSLRGILTVVSEPSLYQQVIGSPTGRRDVDSPSLIAFSNAIRALGFRDYDDYLARRPASQVSMLDLSALYDYTLERADGRESPSLIAFSDVLRALGYTDYDDYLARRPADQNSMLDLSSLIARPQVATSDISALEANINGIDIGLEEAHESNFYDAEDASDEDE